MEIQNYILGKKIGKGAYGSVYVCLNHTNAERRAIKKVNAEPRFKKAALREINFLKQLKESNKNKWPIVDFCEDFIVNDIQYIVFEFLETTLYQYYTNYLISFADSINMGKQMLEGVSYIHSFDIIHCDLKPENIMLDTRNKKIKIIDFGSAMYDLDTKKNFYIQSRYYRAPEIIYELEYTTKIDIWSIGCIIYEILFQIPLFYGKNMIEMAYLFTTVIGIPDSFIPYLTSKKFEKYFQRSSTIHSYQRRPYKKKYHRVNGNGLTFLLNSYLDSITCTKKEREMFIDFIKSIITYDYTKRLTAESLLKKDLFTSLTEF